MSYQWRIYNKVGKLDIKRGEPARIKESLKDEHHKTLIYLSVQGDTGCINLSCIFIQVEHRRVRRLLRYDFIGNFRILSIGFICICCGDFHHKCICHQKQRCPKWISTLSTLTYIIILISSCSKKDFGCLSNQFTNIKKLNWARNHVGMGIVVRKTRWRQAQVSTYNSSSEVLNTCYRKATNLFIIVLITKTKQEE